LERPWITVRGYIESEQGLIGIDAKDEVGLIHFRLVKAGYGCLKEVREMDSRSTLQALYYERFLIDYEKAYREARS
jgi:hypothetical protein